MTLVAIGLGSVVFHATLVPWGQALDEVPMLWLGMVAAYGVLENPHKEIRYGVGLPVALACWALIVSIANVTFEGALQVVAFHTSFAISEIFFLGGSIRLHNSSPDPKVRSLFVIALVLYALSILGWSCDNLLCGRLQNLPYGVPNPEFHAWLWHGGVGYASYCLMMAHFFERQRVLGKPKTSLVWHGLIIVPTEPKEA